MRFGNSCDYFGWVTVRKRVIESKSAIDKAFHALAWRISGTSTTRVPVAGFSTATSDFRHCRPTHVATAASAVQAWAKPGATGNDLVF